MELSKSTVIDVTACLKHILKNYAEDLESVFSKGDIAELLDERDNIIEPERTDGSNFKGYPTRPLYRNLGYTLQRWYNTGICPLEELANYDLLDEKDYVIQRKIMTDEITPQFSRLKSLYSIWSDDEILHSFLFIFKRLGKRGFLDLLGIRKTVGTVNIWPPPRRTLEETFKQRHSPDSDSLLTVGARALAKHSHRDQTTSWWGVCTGSETAKNSHAWDLMQKILDGATWINIHQLPHDVTAIEVRQENGYGVRWTGDGSQFRGFLEPQMADGHEVHWRH